ncbi:hypothetical protein Ndes2526B_g07930 [Nannochloris sp. 'desiccata']|nr:hypothetical protein NADE_007109 [Chlorella desiccata (nom. nud.)]
MQKDGAGSPAAFVLWKPTAMCRVRKALLSDSFAWAVQNGVGVLFTMLFVFIGQMTFTLACVSTCLYSAASQVLSIDRTVGGRLFSAALFTGCMLSSGVLGGALSTLAWLAGGNPNSLLQYLPERFQKIPSKRDIGLIVEWLPKITALPLPDFVQKEWREIQLEISVEEQRTFPQPSDAFYILLMVLFIVVSLPFCVARADKDFKKGILMAIATLFMGSQLIFATLMPTLGLRLYWTQITAGYIKVALVNSGAMVVTGLLFFSTSSYDNVREKLGDLLQGAGALMSKSASIVSADSSLPATITSGVKVAQLRDEESILEAMAKEVKSLAGQDLPIRNSTATATAIAAGIENKATVFSTNNDEESVFNASDHQRPVYSVVKSAQQLQADAHLIDHALSAAVFEPPLPGITSQPGVVKTHYSTVLETAVKLINIAGSIDACALDAYYELNNVIEKRKFEAEIVATGKDAIALVLASCAAVCGDLSVALRHMPLGGVSYGPKMAWKPKDSGFYIDLHTVLKQAAADLTPMLGQVALNEGLDVTEKPFIEGRASLVALINCEVLLKAVQELECDAAVALKVLPPNEPATDAEADKTLIKGQEGEHNEQDKVVKTSKMSNIVEKVKNNGYVSSILVLLVIGLGVLVWVEAVKTSIRIFKGFLHFIRSPRSTLKNHTLLKNPHTQFALKFWLSMSLAMVGIILLLWKGEGSKEGSPLANISNVNYFFFVWQPIYFWITAAICIQKQVEATAFRAILRTTMTVLGGTLGYCTMLNGDLAQNPYFLCCIVCLFNGVCGLFAPIKTLRYSMFLTVFTFNAVVTCQYFGCSCNLPGDPKVFGGKVLSTLFGSIYAMIVTWCFSPYYTSVVMLEEEASALKAGVHLIEIQEKSIRLKAAGQVIDASDDDSSIEKQLREPLARVKAELENNCLDRKQLLLTWNVLPTPPVVSILMEKLSNLANALETAGNIVESTLWAGLPGPAQAELLDDVQPQITAVLIAAKKVAINCSDCMSATNPATVQSTRVTVAAAVGELRAARVALRIGFLSWSDKKNSNWIASDFKFLAWIHSMLISVREIEVVGVILAETEASLDRDTFFSWASAWYGRRPV